MEKDSKQNTLALKSAYNKTEMIRQTNRMIDTQQRFLYISRPRRFGKSMAAYMLAAYYGKECDSSELFAPYKIAEDENYRKYLNQYNVILLNIQDFLSVTGSVAEMLAFLQKRVIRELNRKYPGVLEDGENILSLALEALYSETKEKFIFIVDEWDCILRDRQYSSDDQKRYLDFIRSLLKDKTYVALTYMTGILPNMYQKNIYAKYNLIRPAYTQIIGVETYQDK